MMENCSSLPFILDAFSANVLKIMMLITLELELCSIYLFMIKRWEENKIQIRRNDETHVEETYRLIILCSLLQVPSLDHIGACAGTDFRIHC